MLVARQLQKTVFFGFITRNFLIPSYILMKFPGVVTHIVPDILILRILKNTLRGAWQWDLKGRKTLFFGHV